MSSEEKARIGRLIRPLIPCPVCGKKTRAKHRCKWCNTIWNDEQLNKRERKRREILRGYSEETKKFLKKKGYLHWLR